MTHNLVCPQTASRVSSVLNRDTRQFGKKHLFDQREETCWTSDQWVLLEFPQRVRLSCLQLQFQGGFCSRRGRLHGAQGSEPLAGIADFYPEDGNSLQTFPVPPAEVDRLRLTLEDASDLFGRVVVYHLRVLGEKLA
ncbi:nuclear receptor 2C2-associated protein isoform X2 [Erinaceus europaeus]|uniref:Nuclear receptor 2C2-associated protein isoform X2 n=1 Tax=Erinaceus europaeus TaxID=9365 RepID=A0ABM3WPA9_ERIEU|nr:nuclear receptor 2C2-associated protein isoform X2 [Erinaceus europaeus]